MVSTRIPKCHSNDKCDNINFGILSIFGGPPIKAENVISFSIPLLVLIVIKLFWSAGKHKLISMNNIQQYEI